MQCIHVGSTSGVHSGDIDSCYGKNLDYRELGGAHPSVIKWETSCRRPVQTRFRRTEQQRSPAHQRIWDLKPLATSPPCCPSQGGGFVGLAPPPSPQLASSSSFRWTSSPRGLLCEMQPWNLSSWSSRL